MVLYDWIMIAILVLGVVQGAWRGLARQLAPIASLVLGYIVAVPMSAQLAPWFGDQPSHRFLAILVLYALVSLAVYMIARALRESIERIKLVEFDRHLGAIFGGMKGLLVCLVATFFAVGLSEQARDYVLNTYSGVAAGEVIHYLEPVMPEQMESLLQPYLARIHDPNHGRPQPAPKPSYADQKSTNSDPPKEKRDEPPLPLFLDDVLRLVERIEAQQRK